MEGQQDLREAAKHGEVKGKEREKTWKEMTMMMKTLLKGISRQTNG